jgi:hypothetical protein
VKVITKPIASGPRRHSHTVAPGAISQSRWRQWGGPVGRLAIRSGGTYPGRTPILGTASGVESSTGVWLTAPIL